MMEPGMVDHGMVEHGMVAHEGMVEQTMQVEQSMVDEMDVKPKKKQKIYTQRFRSDWLLDPICKDWIQRDPEDTTQAFCTICYSTLRAKYSYIKQHVKSKKHVAAKATKPRKFKYYYEGQGHEIDTSANQADPSAPISVIISDPSYGNGYRRASRYDDSGDGMQQTPRNKEDDSCDAFGRYVASQLKKLPIKDMLEAQVEIQQLLIQKRLNVMDPEQEPDHNMPHL